MSTTFEELKFEKSRPVIVLHPENIYEQFVIWLSHINWIVLFEVVNLYEIIFESTTIELIIILSGEV